MVASPGHEDVFVRLYLDRHIVKRLAVDLRGRGFDVSTTEEAGKDTASDEEQPAREGSASLADLGLPRRLPAGAQTMAWHFFHVSIR